MLACVSGVSLLLFPQLSFMTLFSTSQNIISCPSNRTIGLQRRARRTRSFLSGVVSGVDVGDTPRSIPVELNNGFLFGPRKMVSLRWHHSDASRPQGGRLLRIQFVSHSNVEGPRDHGNPLNRRVPVSRNFVVGGKLQPKRKRNRLG